MEDQRQLKDLVSVGPATLKDFDRLGITEVRNLIGCDAHELYMRLREIRGMKLDPCCEDVLRAAIAQAEDPRLPAEKKKWPYWSKVRKAAAKGHR